MGKRVYNLEKVLTELRKRRMKAHSDGLSQVKLGYRAPYAVPVHERLDLHHKSPTRAKFLEIPLRTEQRKMADIVRKKLMGRASLVDAQLAAANHVMKVSFRYVPVDTGFLKSSWFIEPVGRGQWDTSGADSGLIHEVK